MSAKGRPEREYRSAQRGGTPASERRYWIAVVSKDHVDRAVAGGYAQVNHGKAGPLERMRAGDGLAFYSPRDSYPDGAPLQAFTAIGRVRSGTVYQAPPDDESRPFRLDVDYVAAAPAPIKPLLPTLSFVRSKTHWGAALRFGIVRIPETDFAAIAAAMGRSFVADFPAPAQRPAADSPAHGDAVPP